MTTDEDLPLRLHGGSIDNRLYLQMDHFEYRVAP